MSDGASVTREQIPARDEEIVYLKLIFLDLFHIESNLVHLLYIYIATVPRKATPL